MDLVNSVTQNSNDRSVPMENQGCGERENDSRQHDSGDTSGQRAQQQMSAPSHENTMASSGGGGGGGSSSGAPTGDGQAKTNAQAASSSSSSSSQVPDYLKAIGMDPRKFWPKKYRFTREKSPGQHNPLTIAQRNFYETNGYIIFDDCANKKLLDAIRSERRAAGSAGMVNEFLLEKLLMRNGKLIPYVKCFCDERLMLMTHRLIDNFNAQQVQVQYVQPNLQHQQEPLKESPSLQQHNNNDGDSTAGTTAAAAAAAAAAAGTTASSREDFTKDLIDQNQQQRQLLFRDWVYLPFRPIDKVCCAITAIEPLEHVLLVVPGTHRVGQCTISSTLDNVSAAYDSSQEKAAHSREIFECSPEKLSTLVDKSKKGFKYLNLKPGQTLFYHPGLIHGFSNDLVNFRKSQLVSIAYYAAADCEYVDLRKSSPDLMQESQQKLQLPISLAHFADKDPRDYTSWLDKPKLLTDPRANSL